MDYRESATVNLQLYDHLLGFQLFQGLSRTELMQLAGSTKFGFLKETGGKPIVKADTMCRQLYFLISGSLELTTRSADGGYSLVEQLTAPWMIQPEALFGSQPRYTGSYATVGTCHFIILSKDEVLRLLDDFLIIRLNLFNILSTRAQRGVRQQWRNAPRALSERFVRFLLDRCTYPAGAKELRMLMTRLADELGDSRLDVSRMLNQLKAEGLLTLHRGRIVVPSLEKLLQGATPSDTFYIK